MKLEKYLYIKGDFRKKFCPKVGCRMIGFETLTPPPHAAVAAACVQSTSVACTHSIYADMQYFTR